MPKWFGFNAHFRQAGNFLTFSLCKIFFSIFHNVKKIFSICCYVRKFFSVSHCENFSLFLTMREKFSCILAMWEIFSPRNRQLCTILMDAFLTFSLHHKWENISPFLAMPENILPFSLCEKKFLCFSICEKISLFFSLWEKFSCLRKFLSHRSARAGMSYHTMPAWPGYWHAAAPFIFAWLIMLEKAMVIFLVREGLPEVPGRSRKMSS